MERRRPREIPTIFKRVQLFMEHGADLESQLKPVSI